MQVKLGWKFIFAFFALNGVVSELHEQAHITTGRVITGCYGPRDFNVWESCAANADVLPWAAPLAGPLFSYLVMWLGVWLLRAAGTRSLGLALVFAPLPFARILTAAMGGGDEKIFLLRLTQDALAPGAARWGALLITLLLAGPPIVLAWRALRNRWRTAYVAGFCVLPLLVIWAYKLRFLNGLLQQGVLAEPVVAGTPLFVLLVLGLMLVATALTWPWLRRAEG
ncbi:hypothetical protein E4L96_19290 [Massilia arenosa]|uniref:Uncharacterized protein n=1 Tax=Zemynaea arenosa TaxID=2561931 RepID=A0A4Y9S2L9_9BURK|nr:hypothetical protein [Massilia arenosa]TFW13758.1 hypothetical protein E4L96_19290 [Massilia arenosa]